MAWASARCGLGQAPYGLGKRPMRPRQAHCQQLGMRPVTLRRISQHPPVTSKLGLSSKLALPAHFHRQPGFLMCGLLNNLYISLLFRFSSGPLYEQSYFSCSNLFHKTFGKQTSTTTIHLAMLATPPPLWNISESRVLGILYNVSKKKLVKPANVYRLTITFCTNSKLAGNS